MNNLSVSDIKLVNRGIKGLILFYSMSQFISFIFSMAVGIIVVSAIGYVVFNAHMWSSDGLFFAFIGALPAVILAREAAFEIGGPGRMGGFSAVNDRLLAYGFEKQESSSTAKEYKYEKKLPSFLRWEKSGVRVSIRNNAVAVSGPYGTFLSLRKFLVKFSD